MQLLKQSILATDLTLYFEYARFDSALFIKLLNLLRGWRSQQRDHQFTLRHCEASLGQHCPPVDCVSLTPVCLRAQEQKQLLRARQHWRVQLECKDSQRHVQVVQRGGLVEGLLNKVHVNLSHSSQVHDDDGV